jgi:hypothetical protein
MLLGIGKIFAEDSQDQPDPAVHAEFQVQMPQVLINRMRGDSESGGNSTFPLVVKNEPRDLQFPFRYCQATSNLPPLPIGQKRVRTADFRACGV